MLDPVTDPQKQSIRGPLAHDLLTPPLLLAPLPAELWFYPDLYVLNWELATP